MRAFDIIRIAISRFKRRDPGRDKPIVRASARPLVSPCSEDEHPQFVRLAKQDTPTTVPPDTQGNRRLDPQPDVEDDQHKLVDVKDAEHIRTESEDLERLRRDLAESRSQVAELQKRCEAQSKDLEGSNNSFNATEKYSDSDIICACRRLNAELQQNTLYMVDCLVENLEFQDVVTNLTKERVWAVHEVSDRIGRNLTESLVTPDTRESIPMMLQIALQAYLASALSIATSCWTSEPGYNAVIWKNYQRLRSVGEEPSALMGPPFYLTRRNLVNRGASHL